MMEIFRKDRYKFLYLQYIEDILRHKTPLSLRIVKDFGGSMVAHCQKRNEKSRH